MLFEAPQTAPKTGPAPEPQTACPCAPAVTGTPKHHQHLQTARQTVPPPPVLTILPASAGTSNSTANICVRAVTACPTTPNSTSKQHPQTAPCKCISNKHGPVHRAKRRPPRTAPQNLGPDLPNPRNPFNPPLEPRLRFMLKLKTVSS